jgi:hypothetical protein
MTRRHSGENLAGFAEMLVVGLGVAVLSLPVVTAIPALAAGVHHLDEHARGGRDSIGRLLHFGVQAIRSGWWFGALSAVVVVALVANAVLASSDAVPGGSVVAVASGLAAAVAATIACRVAALWRPGRTWGSMWRRGRILAFEDPIGSVFVLCGIVVAAVVVWMLPPLVVIAPGLVALATVAAERRRLAQPAGEHG